MLRNLTLSQALERVADEADWREFCALDPVYSMSAPNRSSDPHTRNVQRYDVLRRSFTERLRSKLLNGEWVADGFNPQFGARPVEIGARLWKDLEFARCADGAEGQGYKFVALSFSQVSSARAGTDYREAAGLRRELIRWIENQGEAATGPMTSAQVQAAARRAFPETTISNNMFNEAWRTAKKPDHFRQRGRPKTKVGGG
jgi:hypothetical protein